MRISKTKLKQTMKAQSLTQKKLAEISGVGRVTISNMSRGATCKPETASKIATALGVPLYELVEKR